MKKNFNFLVIVHNKSVEADQKSDLSTALCSFFLPSRIQISNTHDFEPNIAFFIVQRIQNNTFSSVVSDCNKITTLKSYILQFVAVLNKFKQLSGFPFYKHLMQNISYIVSIYLGS